MHGHGEKSLKDLADLGFVVVPEAEQIDVAGRAVGLAEPRCEECCAIEHETRRLQ